VKLTKIWIAAVITTLFLALYAQAADKENVIYLFDHASGSSEPAGGLFLDSSGNLYGVDDRGILFELSPGGAEGWNYSQLAASNCGYPTGPVVRDNAGNFYAGDYFGEICEFSPGSGSWSSSVIYVLNSVSGYGPSNLLVDAAGNLYGVNGANGANGFGYVFELSPGSSGWTLTDLHDFEGTDGNASPSGLSAAGILGGLVMDASGNLYGVTWAGGGASSDGLVFKLANKAGVWTETVLHRFNGADGANPDASLLMDSAGNLYGTTAAGGTDGFGVVFEISLVAGKPLTHVLHNFTNANGDGAYPQSALIMDPSGNLYGTTSSGGGGGDCQVENDFGCGMAFKLSPEGQQWKESLLHVYKGLGDGSFPSGLVIDGSGNLYGEALGGGIFNQGLIFEIMP